MSKTIELAILEAGDALPDVKAKHGRIANWFSVFFEAVGVDWKLVPYEAYAKKLPEPGSHDAYLITGSVHSVLERSDWQAALGEFCKVEAQSGSPVIGICFGHQLLHQHLGGRVETAPEWGGGVNAYDVKQSCDWMDAQTGKLQLCAAHFDQVVEMAPGSSLLAGSDFCPHGMALIGNNILTVQAHPEISSEIGQTLYEARREGLGDAIANNALGSLEQARSDLLVGGWIKSFVEERFNHEH